ncbi:MAG: MBL fold metallo-hydrolase [Burkholderiaceae bacterium]
MAVLLVAASACSPMNPHYDASKAHHTPVGFRNTAPTRNKSTTEFLRWQRERWSLDIAAPRVDLSPVQPDLAFIRSNRTQFAVTYIGHATVLVQLGGINVLTDPHFSQRAFPVQFMGPKRWQRPGVEMADLPHIDVVLISHNHYDHLDIGSVVAKAKRSVGIHWGTFLLTDEPLDQPLADLAGARDKAGIGAETFMTLRHGQTLKLDSESKQ